MTKTSFPSFLSLSIVAFCSLFLMSACETEPVREFDETLKVVDVKAGHAQQNIVYSDRPPVLDGKWKSIAPERAGNGRYAIREYSFQNKSWQMKYTLAEDKKMTKVLFEYAASGIFQIQNPSKRIPGAHLVYYRFQKKSLRVQTRDKKILKEYGFDSCPNLSSEETDIGTHGCGLFPRLSECLIDYDLVRQHQDRLELGDKFAEFSSCTEDKRPVALGFVLEKIN